VGKCADITLNMCVCVCVCGRAVGIEKKSRLNLNFSKGLRNKFPNAGAGRGERVRNTF
jgi:hypothetical protein